LTRYAEEAQFAPVAQQVQGLNKGYSAGMGGALQSVSDKQDAMSHLTGQVLDQARGMANSVADISSNLMVLQQAGVSHSFLTRCYLAIILDLRLTCFSHYLTS